ncbi:MAG: TonB-dependent receptor, partial [Acidobacteria bacterium]|nr:TonB-dependent receptor [Acidobacteriota bacterium]
NWSLAVTDTHIISPTLINTFVLSFNDIQRRQLSVVPGNKTWNDFRAGFSRTFTAEAPAAMHTTVDGYFNAFSRFPLNHFRKNLQFSDVLSWSRGNHFLKIGGDIRRSSLNLQELFRGDPFVRFGNAFSGEAAADFVLGLPLQFEQIGEAANKPRVTEVSFFAQDDWRVSQRLTFNLGLRWDPWFPFVDELNKFAQIRLGQQSTVFPTAPRGVVFPGDEGTNSSLVDASKGNFAPRFGFAFDPDGKAKTAIRGGYGAFYSQVRQQANNGIATNQPFSLRLIANSPIGGVNNPYQGIGNPFPFTPPSTPQEAQKYDWSLPLTMTQWNPNLRNALSQQWNLNLQRDKGNHLLMSTEANPGIFGRTGTLNQRRPLFPTFGPVNDMSSRGNSTYHALQLTANKRFTRGLSIQANYTWSKLMDDASTDGEQPNNPFNFRENRGRSNFDLPHRFVSSFIWQLPTLKGRMALLRYTLGGWETNGIIQLQSGRWLSISSGRDNSQSGTNQDRADLVGDPILPADRPRGEVVARYFRTTAFAQNPAGTFGTAGKNILAGPGLATVDFGVIKSFALRETWRLQFRTEMFNLLNRVNLGNPNTIASSAQFGQITSAGSPRIIQLALRLQF